MEKNPNQKSSFELFNSKFPFLYFVGGEKVHIAKAIREWNLEMSRLDWDYKWFC